MYDCGDGVPKDSAEALKLFRKAADHGCANAQWSLCPGWGGTRYAET
jgi:TPR repeat protein